jgi:N-succinyldiaminopimelate aminotransferase
MNPNLAKLQPFPFEKLRGLFAQTSTDAKQSPISQSIGEPKHATTE